MKRTITQVASRILLVSMMVLGVVSSTPAQSGCSLASLQGSYGILVTGFSQPTGTTVASLPNAMVGVFTADGRGSITSGTFTSSFNGTIQFPPPTQTLTATYTVKPDCTGTLIASGPNGGSVNFVIVARGSQVLFISLGNGPGPVQSGVGIRVDQSVCSLASLQGTYGFHNTGFFQQGGTSVASSPFTTVGIITADGAGNLSGTATASQNGNINQSSTITGTYTVNADCTGTLFTGGGPSASFVIVARGSQLLAISVVPGSVESSIATLSPSALQISAFTTIDVPGSIETDANGINNQGQIAADFADVSGREHGLLLAGGSFTTVDVPGSVMTFANQVNDRGQIAGRYDDNTGKWHGFLLSGGIFTTIDVPGAVRTAAKGINNPGAIVGRYFDASGRQHGFLFAGGGFTTIDVPGAAITRAHSINDIGQIVGRFRDSAGKLHGFLLTGAFTTIDVPGAIATSASSINNRGEIVGWYTDTAGITHGFVLSAGIFRTLDFPGSIETDPFGINDVGQIVGSYADSSGRFHGFLAQR